MQTKFLASLDNLHQIISWIKTNIAPMGFDPKVVRKIELACEETVVNIINHAYSDSAQVIEIDLNLFPKSHVEIVVKDRGSAFNPTTSSPPDLSSSVDERVVGGLGIYFIRKCMDEVSYKYEDGMNILTLIKRR